MHSNLKLPKISRRTCVCTLFMMITFLFSPYPKRLVLASTMSNSEYLIQINSLDTNQTQSVQDNPTSIQSVSKPPQITSMEPNVQIYDGFNYLPITDDFKFTISSQNINYGNLSATNPVIRNLFLKVTEGSAFVYRVYQSENHVLEIPSTQISVPDTTCDTGLCTNLTSSSWESSLTYGIGYRCDNITGSDCAAGFSNLSNFKQISNRDEKKQPETIMGGINQYIPTEVQITYKINVSTTQNSGQYTNSIEYIAIPNF